MVQPLHSLNKKTAKTRIPQGEFEFIFQASIFRGEELLVLGSVHPRKLASNLKIGLSNRKVIFQPSIFRAYVSFREGNFFWEGSCVAEAKKLATSEGGSTL